MGLLGEKKKADVPKVQTVGESSEKGLPDLKRYSPRPRRLRKI
jgi:hypothetical protein